MQLSKGEVVRCLVQQRQCQVKSRLAQQRLGMAKYSRGKAGCGLAQLRHSYVRSGYAKARFCLVSQSKGIVKQGAVLQRLGTA